MSQPHSRIPKSLRLLAYAAVTLVSVPLAICVVGLPLFAWAFPNFTVTSIGGDTAIPWKIRAKLSAAGIISAFASFSFSCAIYRLFAEFLSPSALHLASIFLPPIAAWTAIQGLRSVSELIPEKRIAHDPLRVIAGAVIVALPLSFAIAEKELHTYSSIVAIGALWLSTAIGFPVAVEGLGAASNARLLASPAVRAISIVGLVSASIAIVWALVTPSPLASCPQPHRTRACDITELRMNEAQPILGATFFATPGSRSIFVNRGDGGGAGEIVLPSSVANSAQTAYVERCGAMYTLYLESNGDYACTTLDDAGVRADDKPRERLMAHVPMWLSIVLLGVFVLAGTTISRKRKFKA